MRTFIQQIFGTIQPLLSSTPRYAKIGAWFFAIASAIPLLWLILEGQGSDGSSRVFGTAVDGTVHSVWGLTYSGVPGSILLWLEFLALIAAAVMTILPGSVSLVGQDIVTRMRRIGHGYLTGWAALWMFGAMSLAAADPGFWTVQAVFLMALFACTAYRTWSEWSLHSDDRNNIAPSDQNVNDNHQQFAQSQTGAMPSPSGSDLLISAPHTDIADVSRLMLHRSAVRPSDRVCELHMAIGAPSRSFSMNDYNRDSEDVDEYGATVRATLFRIGQTIRSAGSLILSQARRGASAIGSVIKRTARSA